jgi:hypothetical protein
MGTTGLRHGSTRVTPIVSCLGLTSSPAGRHDPTYSNTCPCLGRGWEGTAQSGSGQAGPLARYTWQHNGVCWAMWLLTEVGHEMNRNRPRRLRWYFTWPWLQAHFLFAVNFLWPKILERTKKASNSGGHVSHLRNVYDFCPSICSGEQ